ncbi:hypothetical protein ADL35_26710, partial [Streptomyces sp. NRRL WC-3753]
DAFDAVTAALDPHLDTPVREVLLRKVLPPVVAVGGAFLFVSVAGTSAPSWVMAAVGTVSAAAMARTFASAGRSIRPLSSLER